MWPVIVRELQAEARHSFTYWLRVLGAGVLLMAAAYFVLESGLSINAGGLLFHDWTVVILAEQPLHSAGRSQMINPPIFSSGMPTREKQQPM